jgi:hypothetical protein
MVRVRFSILISCVLCLIMLLSTGCTAGNLRFAPSESQKQLAYETSLSARQVYAQGTQPASPEAAQIVEGTTAMLSYTGMPASLEIADYPATLAKAQTDAAARPGVEDVAQEATNWLDLIGGIVLAIGGLGGGAMITKAIGWIIKARATTQALAEVVKGNEMFKRYLEQTGQQAALNAFHQAQVKSQNTPSEAIVYPLRIPVKDSVDVGPLPTLAPAEIPPAPVNTTAR